MGYKMVGNSYVHGIMDGEAYDSTKPLVRHESSSAIQPFTTYYKAKGQREQLDLAVAIRQILQLLLQHPTDLPPKNSTLEIDI